MNIKFLDINEVMLITPDVYADDRGFFSESWRQDYYHLIGIPDLIQDNHSHSLGGVIRGLHAQLRRPQGKLVRVVSGTILDVAVDIRPESCTFGKHVSAELSAKNHSQLWVPPGFLHGFSVLSETADVLYKVSGAYDKADEIGVCWNDPDLNIDWKTHSPILSAKDAALPTLKSLISRIKNSD